MNRSAAEILREYGPFPGVDHVHGVTFDGQHVWFASGDKLNAFDPASGKTLRSMDIAAHAGTAFDGQHLFQIAEDRIQKIDPKTGRVLATIPAPGGGRDSGLAWAEGTLWVGQHRDRKIHQIDPQTGAILRTIESNRFVTGVTWIAPSTPRAGKPQKVLELKLVIIALTEWATNGCSPALSLPERIRGQPVELRLRRVGDDALVAIADVVARWR
jgi:hypothetical protein